MKPERDDEARGSSAPARAGVTAAIADFAHALRHRDIPADVLEAGRRHMLDAFGLMAAGGRTEGLRILHRLHGLQATPGARAARVFAGGVRLPVRAAALLNAAAVHADDYDDTCQHPSANRNAGIHATAPVFAAALAAAEACDAPSEEIETAVHAGIEAAIRINHAIAARHYDEGFHATGTISTFGAALAAGRILGLDRGALAQALGVAASLASGLRCNFGTMTKPLHAGRAAENGVVAAELAEAGFTAAPDALESPRGFFRAAGGGFDADRIIGRLGDPWAFQAPGLWLKRYPCGALAQPALTLIEDWLGSGLLHPDRIASMDILTNAKVREVLFHDDPQDEAEAKFSLRWLAAALLVVGRLTLAEFVPEVVGCGRIRSLMRRISHGVHAETPAGASNVTTLIHVALVDGGRLDGRADCARGSPSRPLTDAETVAKFLECSRLAGWSEARAAQAAEAFLSGRIAAAWRI